MNRRKFAKSTAVALGFSAVSPMSVAWATKPEKQFKTGQTMKSSDGLKMTISQRDLATKSEDQKQFFLTFDVETKGRSLSEKIYHLTDANGVTHNIFMKPVGKNKLLAEFNWRTND